MKETMGDKLGRGVGWLLGKGARAGVSAIAKLCGARTDSGLVNGLKEIAETAGQATGRTAGRLFDLGIGLATAVGGVVSGNGDKIKGGLSTAGSAVGKMAGAALAGTVVLGAKAVETVICAGRAVSELANGNEEDARKNWEKAKDGLVWTGKALVASAIAIGPFEAVGVTDIIPDGEASVSDAADMGIEGEGITGTTTSLLPGVADMPGLEHPAVMSVPDINDEQLGAESAIAGYAGLLPDIPATVYDADGDGFADPGTVDELVEAGYVDDAHYVADPPRDPTVRDEFLRRHGLDGVPAGYEVHHIVPLYAGGADSPENMILVKVEDHAAIHRELDRMYHEEKGFPVK